MIQTKNSLPDGKAKATVNVKVTLWSPFVLSNFLSTITILSARVKFKIQNGEVCVVYIEVFDLQAGVLRQYFYKMIFLELSEIVLRQNPILLAQL